MTREMAFLSMSIAPSTDCSAARFCGGIFSFSMMILRGFFFLFLFVLVQVTSALGSYVAAVLAYFFQVHAAVGAETGLDVLIAAGRALIIFFRQKDHDFLFKINGLQPVNYTPRGKTKQC